MPEKPDIKKAIETIVGHDITDEELQRFHFFLKTATWDQTNLPGQGFVTIQHQLIQLKFCQELPLLDVSAAGRTDSAGTRKLRLTDFICRDRLTFETPINIVATPLARIPVFVTVLHSLVLDPSTNLGIDVDIQVFSWDANGAPAPNIDFNWRCRVGFQEPGPL